LIKEFGRLIDEIDLNELGMKEKIRLEVERFKKFQKLLSGNSQKINTSDIDIRNYAKFVLQEGTILEKRELLGNVQGKIILKDKIIAISLTN
jgi:hypothetical protein